MAPRRAKTNDEASDMYMKVFEAAPPQMYNEAGALNTIVPSAVYFGASEITYGGRPFQNGFAILLSSLERETRMAGASQGALHQAIFRMTTGGRQERREPHPWMFFVFLARRRGLPLPRPIADQIIAGGWTNLFDFHADVGDRPDGGFTSLDQLMNFHEALMDGFHPSENTLVGALTPQGRALRDGLINNFRVVNIDDRVRFHLPFDINLPPLELVERVVNHGGDDDAFEELDDGANAAEQLAQEHNHHDEHGADEGADEDGEEEVISNQDNAEQHVQGLALATATFIGTTGDEEDDVQMGGVDEGGGDEGREGGDDGGGNQIALFNLDEPWPQLNRVLNAHLLVVQVVSMFFYYAIISWVTVREDRA